MSLSQILAAMMQSSGQAPQVTPMGAAPSGGGGGGGVTPIKGGNLNMNFNRQQRPVSTGMPEIEQPVGIDPSQPPIVFGTDDIYEQQDMRQRQSDRMMIAEEFLLAQQEFNRLQNPRTFRDWRDARGGGREEAQQRINQAQLGVMEYNQQQQLELQQQEASRVQGIADNVFDFALDAYGDPEVARNFADAAMRDPDNANKIVDAIASSTETQRTEFREDMKAQETMLEKRKSLLRMTGDEEFAKIFSRNEDMSSADIMEVYWKDEDRKIEAIERFNKEQNRINDAISNADNMIEVGDEALTKVGLLTTGFGGLLQLVPGTPAADLRELASTLKANVGFKALFDMRQASASGGALGNVSNQEIKLLQDSLRSLSQTQSPEQLTKNINKVIEQYQRVKVVMDMEQSGAFDGLTGIERNKMVNDHMDAMRGGAIKTPSDEEKASLRSRYMGG